MAIITTPPDSDSVPCGTEDSAPAIERCIYTQTQQPLTQLQSWIADGRLYAMVDGLQQPELAAIAHRCHPTVDTALYGDFSDGQYRQLSPHILQVDKEVLQWLMPIIEQDPAWGWFMLPHSVHRDLSVNALLHKLIDHYRFWSVLPNKLDEGLTIFRLQDAGVLQQWLVVAEDKFVQAFMGVLQSVLIPRDQVVNIISLTAPNSQQVVMQRPPQPWPTAMLHAVDSQYKNALQDKLMGHLRDHHLVTREWEDDKLRQFVIDNSNNAYGLGFDTPSAIAKYLSICTELGADFAEGEQGAWAQSVLNHPLPGGQTHVIDALVRQAADRLAEAQPTIERQPV